MECKKVTKGSVPEKKTPDSKFLILKYPSPRKNVFCCSRILRIKNGIKIMRFLLNFEPDNIDSLKDKSEFLILLSKLTKTITENNIGKNEFK